MAETEQPTVKSLEPQRAFVDQLSQQIFSPGKPEVEKASRRLAENFLFTCAVATGARSQEGVTPSLPLLIEGALRKIPEESLDAESLRLLRDSIAKQKGPIDWNTFVETFGLLDLDSPAVKLQQALIASLQDDQEIALAIMSF